MSRLDDQEIDAALDDLAGWQRDGDEIVRELRLDDFKSVVALVVALAFEAEAANHHPDLDIRYNRLTVRLSTHSEGGITGKDIDLAGAIEHLAGRLSGS
jgi:4a-hydroxytetrahydrobiopterin dehydratase